MITKKLEGIIINTTTYKESSQILNIYTLEYGIIGVMARGSKNIKNRLSGLTNKLTYGIFYLEYRDNGLSNLLDVDIISHFKNIKKDLVLTGYALYLTELVFQVAKNDTSRQIYLDYIASLNKIEEGYDPMIIRSILEVKLLNYLGIGLSLDKCSICGSKNDILTISSTHGGYVCKNCYKAGKIVDIKTIKLLRMLNYIDISKIGKTEVSMVIKREINDFLEEYYDLYAGLYLKSREFLKKLI